ncbi:protein-arginine N5-methyltransferase [Aspergillus clavatus NRRL 1]|uniref:Arginine N-methyltransferase 2 n=1 Tax=Aspergillus clavatus (strain ATCC 1007 / CBS 513.65 / DSM 816 / NCTC 3887 / NRRL 1 / QM 1276 / 107) TaxID=344612 RepID=A1CSW8_ASPCL|nr:arginine N-methyltransferase (Rmt2), putative [Aspergillus clavatus NRRL 1]EAW06405.1 arginine N-methyltransferase (Rmt2), putative [Aspergillus clavatus NRRL 1]
MADPITDVDVDVDLDIQEILLAASQHNIPTLRRLIRANDKTGNPANVKDPETGFTPLHAAIAACELDEGEGAQTNGASGSEQKSLVQLGVDTVRFLLQEGAIWNDLDVNDETPGCLARRLGLTELYEMLVDAGVRAELLLNRLDGYEELSDDEDEDEDEDQEMRQGDEQEQEQQTTAEENQAVPELVEASATTTAADPDVTSSRYLDSNLTFQNDRLLDQDQNGVMMAWETEIMSKSAKKLLPTTGLRVLNVGHGMGIVDGFIQEQQPAAHHIVEAHPEVVAEMKRRGWHEKPGVHIHEGRWQDILPALVAQGETFDAIYYDTFAESYADFREFFSEQVIGLLEQEGKWGFFNGMGADRQISYDVYQKVVEMDLFEAGFDVEWEDMKVPKLEGEWNGVRRPYWVVDNYRLPLCKFMD